MSTIVTRAGKGSPLTNTELDSNFTNLNTDKAELSGATFTGNLSLGDNVKAQFGAGDDLEIFSNGSTALLKAGNATSDIRIESDNRIVIADRGFNEAFAVFNDDNDVKLYHNGSLKIATTATGADITGVLTADGLTSELGSDAQGKFSGWSPTGSTATHSGAIELGQNASYQGIISYDAANDTRFIFDNSWSGTGSTFEFRSNTAATPKTHLKVEGSGDISFYEDTGTTPKFFWDASAESLGIGTSSPANSLHVSSSSANSVVSYFNNTDTSNGNGILVRGGGSNSGKYVASFQDASANTRMQILSNGNVGIGTSSPSNAISVYRSGTNTATIELDNAQVGTAAVFGRQGSTAYGATGVGEALFYTYDNSISIMADGGAGNTASIKFSTGGNTERMRIDSSGNVGIGQTPTNRFDVTSSAIVVSRFRSSAGGSGARAIHSLSGNGNSVDGLVFVSCGSTSTVEGGANAATIRNSENAPLIFGTNNTERMRIDSSGNLLVGTTNVDPAGADVAGTAIGSTGYISMSRSSGAVGIFNRKTNDGNILEFNKDGTTVGSIGAQSGRLTVGSNSAAGVRFDGTQLVPMSGASISDNTITLGDPGFRFKDLYLSGTAYVATDGVLSETAEDGSTFYFSNNNIGLKAYSYISSNRLIPCDENGANRDNYVDLGQSNARFDDIYATNGTIQTSDRNEKQDIEALSDAEQRVAVACKGLLRKFRWRDSVEAKGNEARTHFGIIAQDLQAAFAAEGLDAGDYAMFISSTWTDEETGEERTRMGVRYSELLAFIIAAI